MILISYYSLFTSGLLIIVSRLYEILNWELHGIYANEYVKSTTLLHGCFSRFVNRTNGTKLLKAPHMHTEISLMFAVKSRRIASLNCSFLKNVIALRVSWNLLQFKKSNRCKSFISQNATDGSMYWRPYWCGTTSACA